MLIRKTYIILLLAVFGVLEKANADVVVGTVVLDHYQCKQNDRIVIETYYGFSLAEVYSGYSETYEGKTIYGNLNSYGFIDFLSSEGGQSGRLYIDDYMVDKAEALKWCFEE